MILLLGGTHEGAEISELLNYLNLSYVLSVTTELGKDLYKKTAPNCIIKKFTSDSLKAYIIANDIHLIIDATHPHADLIKSIARVSAMENDIIYWRYARETINADAIKSVTYSPFESMAEAIDNLKETITETDRLLITGSKHIPDFLKHFNTSQCVFRIMPGKESMNACINQGIPIQNIIAIKAPCSVQMNHAIFKDYGITHFVFKNSGRGSAFEANLNALKDTSVKGIVIEPRKTIVDEVYSSLIDLERALINISSLKIIGRA